MVCSDRVSFVGSVCPAGRVRAVCAAPRSSRPTTGCTRTFIDPDFRLATRRYAISTTYDGRLIASREFAIVCAPLPGIAFLPLRSEPEFKVLRVDQAVHVDPIANGTRFGAACDECALPRYVIGPGRPDLQPGESLPIGLTRTDLGYGDTADFAPEQPNHLGPVILADESTAAMLNASGLPGAHLFLIG